ncbi:MAG TPA: SDR family oxidoreductase [Polyangiaceae bacterium]|nr:SDR family oxidoreductase [Polyangiaceae bacterium]
MSGRVSMVTGAASGIGRALVTALVAAGDRVVAADVDAEGLGRAGEAERWPEARVSRRRLDVRDAGAWSELVASSEAELGGLDVLVNNAGVLKPGSTEAIVAADVDFHLDVNAKGTILGTVTAARAMAARGRGHIVNIASLAALAPVPGLALYSASKHAVRGFSLSAAIELRPRGVWVTCVCPDAVATPMLDMQLDFPEAAITFSGAEPLTAAAVARAVVDVALRKRPVELVLPPSRGFTAKAASVLPELVHRIAPVFVRKGRERQDAMRKNR